MQQEPAAAEFGIEEARRVLGEVFAPWVQDLGLSIIGIDHVPPPDGADDWQPGAVLRMPFSERLCRNGGIVCGQALMAFADTAMVIANLAANRGYRAMTTVDQTTHFHARRHKIGRAGGCAGGPARAHHELRPRHPVERCRQQTVGDGIERVCDTVRQAAHIARDLRRIIVNQS
jgi:acyl-coenzyme A thioesterase PaaI-like protein